MAGMAERRRSAGTRRGGWHRLLLPLVLLLVLPALSAAEDAPKETPRAQLNRAAVLEQVQGDPEAALGIYEGLIRSPEFADLPPELRAAALLGAARCHHEVGTDAAASKHWEAIRADDTLPDDARTVAAAELQKRAKADSPQGADDEDAERRLRARLLAERRAEDMRKAQEHVEDARKALAAGRYDEATRLCFEALSKDETNQEANALLMTIEAQRPDLGGLLNHLIRFFQTQELTEFERVRDHVQQLEELGSSAFNKRDWKEADTQLRKAIRVIDESNFLTLGGALDTNSLDAARARLVVWLRQAGEQGAEQGLRFDPVPPLPDIEARRGGLQQQFFGIMAQVFSPEEDGGTPLNFYKFAPTYKQGAAAKRELDRILFTDLKATHREGNLTRAHWAETWIRNNIGARWSDPRAERGTRDGRSSRHRLLLRLGDLICAQSRGGEHARIEKLRRSFDDVPPPLNVEVHVFAAGSGGAVRAAEALRIRSGPRDPGLVHVTGGSPVGASAKLLTGLDPTALIQLGSARIRLDGETSVLLELTEFTAEHPAYRHVPPPELAVPDADARFGLWLDLYAEDMPGGSTKDRSALAARARITQPNPLVSSFVIPRTSGVEQPYTRLPLLTEVVREANRIVPHYGTLVLQGLPNPFPATNQEFSELLVLIGTTRQDTPIPDPPRVEPSSPRIDPEDTRIRDFPLGSLSITVQDDIVPEGWPERRTIAAGLSQADRRRLRDGNLANILMQMANIDPNGPGGAEAVQVQDHRAVGSLSPDEQMRLERAVVRLRARENDLYVARVLAAVVDRPLWNKWSKLPGMRANSNANVIATGEGRAFVEQELSALAQRSGLFNTGRELLLRATQQRAHANLHTRAITKGLRVRLLPRGKQRYTAEEGVAEEGLVVEIRPGLEVKEGGGLRTVRVRARAARLDRIESRAYPGATQAAALYDVPIWHAGTDGSLSERTDAEILGNDGALLLPISLPGSDDKIVLVFVNVTRVQ